MNSFNVLTRYQSVSQTTPQKNTQPKKHADKTTKAEQTKRRPVEWTASNGAQIPYMKPKTKLRKQNHLRRSNYEGSVFTSIDEWAYQGGARNHSVAIMSTEYKSKIKAKKTDLQNTNISGAGMINRCMPMEKAATI